MAAKISTYLIGIVIFMLVMVAGISMIGILGDGNPDLVNNDKYSDFNKTANKLNEITTSMDTLQEGIIGAEVDPGALGVLSSLINTAWATLKVLPTMFSFMVTAYFELAALFGVPAWIPGLLSGIVVIILVFVLYGAFLQHDL